MFRTILFDLDGTLIDTEPAAARAVVETFREWGIAADASDARYVTGRTWETAFEYLFSKYPPPVPRAEAGALMLRRYRESMREELIEIPGAVGAVRKLSEAGLRIGLVSGSHRAQILYALEKLAIRDRFEAVLGAEDYPRSKPAPDGYLAALARLGEPASTGLVFEDSEPGIASGKAAGLAVVAVSVANHFGHDTGAADGRIRDFTGVDAAWVERFWAGR